MIDSISKTKSLELAESFGKSKPLSLSLLFALVFVFSFIVYKLPSQAKEPVDNFNNRENIEVAGVTTVYYENSHADLILGRLPRGLQLNDQEPFSTLNLKTLFVDQFPANDLSRELAKKHRFTIEDSVKQTLLKSDGGWKVDAVMLVAEHGDYPESEIGSFIFPKRRMFAEIVAASEESRSSIPVFFDKHLADNWQDAHWIYKESKRLQIPLLAGSSVPLTWRYPPVDIEREKKLAEIVVLSYHRLDSYGFHALEALQALAERRPGGETGIRKVQTLTGVDAWNAIAQGRVSRELVELARRTFKDRPLPQDGALSTHVPDPTLFLIEYEDGLRASVLSLGQAYIDWTAAWRFEDGSSKSTVFWVQDERPFSHFEIQVREIEKFFVSKQSPWPIERTLLTTGLLEALLQSKHQRGASIETPLLKEIEYQSTYNWQQPPAID